MKKYLTVKNIEIITAIFLFVIIAYLYKSNGNKPEALDDSQAILKEDSSSIEEPIYVDIKGAVKKPGVYQFTNNNIVIDAINKAGGLSKYGSTININLSKKLFGEMVIYVFTTSELKKKKTEAVIISNVPECKCETIVIDDCISDNNEAVKDEGSSVNDQTSSSVVPSNILININVASVLELQNLSGIGESKANAIITYRETIGNFIVIEDIKKVSGIGDSIYNDIKDKITV